MNKTGYYLTTDGYKPCCIIQYFSLYGEDYADIVTLYGKTQVKKWKVIEDRN